MGLLPRARQWPGNWSYCILRVYVLDRETEELRAGSWEDLFSVLQITVCTWLCNSVAGNQQTIESKTVQRQPGGDGGNEQEASPASNDMHGQSHPLAHGELGTWSITSPQPVHVPVLGGISQGAACSPQPITSSCSAL